MKTWSSALVALAMAAACATAPTPAARGDRLMAQMKAAMGGPALDRQSTFHGKGTAQRGGKTVSYELWGDMRGFRSASLQTVDGRMFGGGFDGETAWGLGPDGSVRANASPDAIANARSGTYLSVAGYFFPDRFPATFTYRGRQSVDGRDYDQVEAMLAGGAWPVLLWLDPQTHVLKRLSATQGKDRFDATLDHYRTIDGVQVAFHSAHYDNDLLEDQTLTLYEYAPVPADRFSPPK